MNLFAQNSKMKTTSEGKPYKVINFGIPAFESRDGFRTCTNAGKCAGPCYARVGHIKNVAADHYEYRLEMLRRGDFVDKAEQELVGIVRRSKKPIVVRIMDSGDFYDQSVLDKWIELAWRRPEVRFYAYTKMVRMFKKAMAKKKQWPANFFRVIFSYGGTEDRFIHSSPHSKIFKDAAAVEAAGYDLMLHDDSLAWTSSKIGLPVHGSHSNRLNGQVL